MSVSLKERTTEIFNTLEGNFYVVDLLVAAQKYRKGDWQTRRESFESITSQVITDRHREYLSLINRFDLTPEDRQGLRSLADNFCSQLQEVQNNFYQVINYSELRPFFMYQENILDAQKLDAHYRATQQGFESNITVTYDPDRRNMELKDPDFEVRDLATKTDRMAMNVLSREAFELSDQMIDILFPIKMTVEQRFALFTSQEDMIMDRLLHFDLIKLGKADVIRFFQYFFAQSLWQVGNMARVLSMIDTLNDEQLATKMRHMRPFMDLFNKARECEEYKDILKLDWMQGKANAYLRYGTVNWEPNLFTYDELLVWYQSKYQSNASLKETALN